MPKQRATDTERGNFVSEWFGHRVYPTVARRPTSLEAQSAERCPFLSVATREETHCVKPVASSGICTISSCSNGPRQDWLVCPYRALDSKLLEDSARRLFSIPGRRSIMITPAPTVARSEVREALTSLAVGGDGAIIYFQDKLGGEISIAPTDRSPEVAFDITMVEIAHESGALGVGRYGILEVQTMDFHGSYRHVVKNLKDALRLHGSDFPRILQGNQGWLSERIEGPNIANVFKRTFYQMMLKFQIATQEGCVGCVLAVPKSVWDSWQRHLGKPELESGANGLVMLRRPGSVAGAGRVPAWIYVFDVEAGAATSPNPIGISTVIGTDAESVSYYALKVAPDAAVAAGGSVDRLLATVRRRLATWWPEVARNVVVVRPVKGKQRSRGR